MRVPPPPARQQAEQMAAVTEALRSSVPSPRNAGSVAMLSPPGLIVRSRLLITRFLAGLY